jgi:signal transduction histidine kinase
MQEEFINIAAHELRTPIQPILGLTGILRSNITTIGKTSAAKQGEFLHLYYSFSIRAILLVLLF